MNWGAASGQVLLLRETDSQAVNRRVLNSVRKAMTGCYREREREGEREGEERERGRGKTEREIGTIVKRPELLAFGVT